MEESEKNNNQIWEQIQETFSKIKEEAGVEPDEQYMSELEELLGMSIEDMNQGHIEMIKTKTVGVTLINDDAKFPSYAYESDSGFDLYSTIEQNIPPLGRALIPTGIKLSIPDEYEIQVRPKSGLALNKGLTVLNTPGTVDQGYTGEIQVIVFNTNNETVTISKGMKIAQAVLCPVVNGKYVSFQTVEKIEDKDRGDNGFGSTGLH